MTFINKIKNNFMDDKFIILISIIEIIILKSLKLFRYKKIFIVVFFVYYSIVKKIIINF